MGITVHYRGKVDDIAAIESLEDYVIDLALAFGGQVQLWRSAADRSPQRAVRGVLVNLAPGQETFSLLFSPESILIMPTDIEGVEERPLGKLPWCFVKTQFGSVEGHAALVETLLEIKRQFIPNLEVNDESDYWTHRDPTRLAASMQRSANIIKAVSDGLEKHPLSHEACEDTEIIVKRVTRVVQKVHQVFRQSDKQLATSADAPDEFQADWTEIEAQWDKLYRDGMVRSIRMQRHIESQLLAGHTPKEALESALAEIADERIEVSPADDIDYLKSQRDIPSELDSPLDRDDDDVPSDELWAGSFDSEQDSNSLFGKRDPLLERSTQLFLEVAKLTETTHSSGVGTILESACQLCGGLSQVLPLPPRYEMDENDRGLVSVQLKRALRGAAFLKAALHNLHCDDDRMVTCSRLLEEIEVVQGEIIDHLRTTRA